MAVKASRTSSSLNGLMIAITIFMGPIPGRARARRDRAFSTEVHHAEKFTTRAQPAPRESNAVPDRPCSLTDYERGPFRAFPQSPRPALFGRAQSLIIPAQNEGTTGSRHNLAYRTGRKTVFRWEIQCKASPRCEISMPRTGVRRHLQRHQRAHELERHVGHAVWLTATPDRSHAQRRCRMRRKWQTLEHDAFRFAHSL